MSDETTTDADSLQRQSALTGDSPLPEASCCASSDFIAEAPTPDNPSGLNYWRDREISPSTVCLWPFPSLSELLLGVQCLSVVGIWDRNSRYGQLLRDVSNLWTTLDRPSISWPECVQEKVILPVSVVMGYLQTWMDGVISAQRQGAMKPRKDSADRGAGSGCMARLVRFSSFIWDKAFGLQASARLECSEIGELQTDETRILAEVTSDLRVDHHRCLEGVKHARGKNQDTLGDETAYRTMEGEVVFTSGVFLKVGRQDLPLVGGQILTVPLELADWSPSKPPLK